MVGFTAWVAGASLLNVAVAAAVVLLVYRLIEEHVGLAAVVGIGLAAAVIYAEATLGEQLLMVTVSEMKLLVLAAAVGAAAGVTGTVLVFKPATE